MFKRFETIVMLLAVLAACAFPAPAQEPGAAPCEGCALELDVRYLGYGIEMSIDWGSGTSGSCLATKVEDDRSACLPEFGCRFSGVVLTVTNRSINSLWSHWAGGSQRLWANGDRVTISPDDGDVPCGTWLLWSASENKDPNSEWYTSAWIKCGNCQ